MIYAMILGWIIAAGLAVLVALGISYLVHDRGWYK